ncbi:RagB/SusD family nutrient uptake outer membrane protein [Mariniphaga sediminis]|nr:RagB/SusD family nutrient uptake outer membrane protein [Mariniphaga sediminis]
MLTKKSFLIILITLGFIVSSCEMDFLQPFDDNHSSAERLYYDSGFAEGLLIRAYRDLPNGYSFDEASTDDAVTNVEGNNYRRMGTGEWSSRYDPMSIWNLAYTNIYYLNYFLEINPSAQYAWDEANGPVKERNEAFRKRFEAEALLLRAWYNFELLKRHGGIAEDGNPTGFVLLENKVDINVDYNLPRNSYEECVQAIYSDIEKALLNLPDEYSDSEDIVQQIVFGSQNKNRVNGKFGKALKSRVSLHVASQPFYTGNEYWEKAAVYAGALLSEIGGVSGMSPTGVEFWKNENDSEILWRRDYSEINSREVANFPPTLFGQGQTNPSQNLVDAFPMVNGYPINAEESGYDANQPYAGRDPRLKRYIIYNGNDFDGRVININDETDDWNNQTVYSTRTGYYLKKLLQPSVNINPNVMSTARHFYPFFRYTEIFLNYAEAANEAWGPTADPNGYGFTPAEIISALRERAGITQPDEFIIESSTSKELMRALIQNERRIELCFEGFRFWDIRRWGMDLNETVNGVLLTNETYNVVEVEKRNYKSHMNFGPISQLEILKADKLIQNKGW